MPIEKRKGETRDEFISRCVKTEMNSGKPQDQALAICLTYADENFKSATASKDFPPANIEFESYNDYPKAASENAKIALRWAEENGWGSCGTPVGKARANQLANGENISRDTIARMAAFERHRQNSQKELGDGCGRLVWLAWGGDEGIEWAQRKLKQIDNQNLANMKISFDYDDTLSTEKGMEMAKKAIDNGDTVYIISARSDKSGMLRRADELGIPHSRVFATGSNKAKAEKVKELGINKHIDNNSDVVNSLPGIGQKFAKVKKVIFNEDFNEEDVKKYKDLGFKVFIRSSRKIKKKDKKVWNKLKSVGLNEDVIVFGDLESLNKRYEFDLFMTGSDPILEALLTKGTTKVPKKILNSEPVYSFEEAKQKADSMLKSVDLKFVTVKVLYTYETRTDVPSAASGSRPFCTKMMSQKRYYTLDEISNLPNEHLKEMFKDYNLEPDVFAYRGGFYRLPGTLTTTPWCRHEWRANVVLE